ncbi:Alkyl transferase [[Candida] zeylanoides]
MSSSFQDVLDLFKAIPLVTYGVGIAQDMILSVMKNGPVPRHVALIMDGNRTFARNNKLPLKDGHNAGAQTLVQVLDVCFRLGVEHVTVYAFSIENFNRSKEEVDTLFELLRDKLDGISRNEDSYTLQNKVRVKIIGNKTLIPLDILKDLETIEARTSTSESKRALNVCFPYTSRDEITHAIRQIAQRTVNGGIDPKDIGVKDLHDALYSGPDTPPLDLLIRTSGHTRLSDFMLWQCNSNCTIEFVNTLWPDFS